MARVEAWVVVTQARPRNATLMGITGPTARMAANVGSGSALKAAAWMSKLKGWTRWSSLVRVSVIACDMARLPAPGANRRLSIRPSDGLVPYRPAVGL